MRDVKVKIDMDRLRAYTGLSKAQLPDDASDQRIGDVLAMSGFLTQSGRMQGGGSAPTPEPSVTRPAPAPGGENYDRSWLTPQERARIEAAEDGRPHTNVVHGG